MFATGFLKCFTFSISIFSTAMFVFLQPEVTVFGGLNDKFSVNANHRQYKTQT